MFDSMLFFFSSFNNHQMSGPVVRSGVSGESPGAVISGKEDTQKPPIVLIINKSFSYHHWLHLLLHTEVYSRY